MKIALIGRPNVGKSSLFNRIIERRQAIETNMPGTTRDQNRGILYFKNIKIELIDSPGLIMKHITHNMKQEIKNDDILERNIQLQVERAAVEADIILYVIDFKIGPTPEDYGLIKKLRREKRKPTILTVNKADKNDERIEALKYIKLGLGEPEAVSAKNGRGVMELLERIAGLDKKIRKITELSADKSLPIINLSIIGKPNVGKSSLFNALLQEEKVVVSPVPHTTRDPNNTQINYNNYQFNLIDTAGLRKKARLYESDQAEIFSVQKTLEVIKKSAIALLIIDCSQSTTTQDLKISKLINDNYCGLIIIANKWDKILDKNTGSLVKMREYIYARFKSLNWAPLIFTNVKKPKNGQLFGLEEKYLKSFQSIQKDLKSLSHANPLYQLLDLVIAVNQNQNQYLPQEELNLTLRHAIKKQPPPKAKGLRRPRITNFKQIEINPPSFMITLPPRTKLPQSYLGYLKKQLRAKFGLWGTVIHIKCQISSAKNKN
ncbi:MAG: ribosome biogenesis GTPase Der [Candidatus Jacksonbacteria bacterium]